MQLVRWGAGPQWIGDNRRRAVTQDATALQGDDVILTENSRALYRPLQSRQWRSRWIAREVRLIRRMQASIAKISGVMR